MTATCTRPTCTRVAQASSDLCQPHFRAAKARGECGRIDATPAVEHLRKLRSRRWTPKQICAASGVCFNQLWHLEHGRTIASAGTVKAILSVPLAPAPPSRIGVDSTGTRRRAQAMAWMGHSLAEQSVACGMQPRTLDQMIRKTRVSSALARAVADLYRQRWNVPGSPNVAARARAAGFHPPGAWDDDTIDNPDAQPDILGYDLGLPVVAQMRVLRLARGEHLKDMTRDDQLNYGRYLLADGVSWYTMSKRTGLTEWAAEKLAAQQAATNRIDELEVAA